MGIALGVIEIVVGAVTWYAGGEVGVVAGVASIIGGAAAVVAGSIGLAFGSNIQSAAAANSSALKFATTQEGLPLPVIWGTQKVTPQFMNWSADQFYSEAVKTGGKGGGASQVTGYNYFLTFELAYCVGAVDEIGQVISSPGDIFMRGNQFIQTNINILNNQWHASQDSVNVSASSAVFNSSMVGAQIIYESGESAIITAYTDSTHVTVDTAYEITTKSFQIYAVPAQVVFGIADEEVITLQGGFITSNATSYTEGGSVRFYKGSSTQTRNPSGDPYMQPFISGSGFNYRNIFWGLFMKYQIGQDNVAPKTYQAVLTRFPKCIRDDGSTVTGILTRGSNDSTDPCYNYANPAAIFYEIITNGLWGGGKSSDLIDEPSFITCSEFFAANNLGISMTLDSTQKMSDLFDVLKQHVKTFPMFRNGKYVLVCQLDPTQVAGDILTLTSADVGELSITRPLWPVTSNDIRVEYNSRLRLWKSDIAHVQDSANADLTGRINPQTISLMGFNEYETAMQQGARILRESSYPYASAVFYINRFHSQLELGQTFRLQWQEWGDSAVTAYFDVQKLEPQDDDDRIKVTAIESVFFCPVNGIENTIALPTTLSWQQTVAVEESDRYFFGGGTATNKTILPVCAFELPAIFTGGKTEQVLIIGEKPAPSVDGIASYYKQIGTKYLDLGLASNVQSGGFLFAKTGTLLTNPSSSLPWDRSQEFFQFSINNLDYVPDFLEINAVVNITDDLEVLTENPVEAAMFLIGEELILVGCVEQIATNQFRCRNVVRGYMGTIISSHAAGDTFFWIDKLVSGYDGSKLAQSTVTAFRAYPSTNGKVQNIGNDFFLFHAGNNNTKYLGLGVLPLAPERYSITKIGSTYTALVRPKFFDSGAGTNPLLGQYDVDIQLQQGIIAQLKQDVGLMTFQVGYYDASNNLLTRSPTAHTFTPESYSLTSAGLVEIQNIPLAVNGVSIRRIEIYSYMNKQLSQQAAVFAV